MGLRLVDRPGISGPVHEQCRLPCWWLWECRHRKPSCHKIGVRCVSEYSEPEVDSERSQSESRIGVVGAVREIRVFGMKVISKSFAGQEAAGNKSKKVGDNLHE